MKTFDTRISILEIKTSTGVPGNIPNRQPHPRDETGSRDWPEDATYENGSYFCICCICNCEFISYKRRIICKKCATNEVS